MLTRSEFDAWFDDYRGRFPAVNDYLARQPTMGLVLETWYASVSAFDGEILASVTESVISGDFDPVPNVQLGQFGNEIRKLCRAVLGKRREQDHRQEWKRETGKPYQPLFRGQLVDMYRCAEAVHQLIRDEAAESDCGSEGSWNEAPMTPSRAAIVLADDHSANEERQCLAVLESVGLSWQQVQDTAARVGVFLQEVEDGEVGS